MKNKFILNEHIRYREEDSYILICDCKKLMDYRLPLEYLKILDKLSIGCIINEKNDAKEKLVLNDLLKMGIVVDSNKQNSLEIGNNLINISYKETEFIK